MLSLLLATLLSVRSEALAAIGRDLPVGRIAEVNTTTHVDAGQAFEAVALSWTSDGPRRVRIRGAANSDWLSPAFDGDTSDPSSGRYRTAILHLGGPHTELDVTSDGALDDLVVTVFPEPQAREGARRAATASYAFGPVSVVSRTDWGCPDGEESRWTPAFTTVTHAVVHHTAGSNTLVDWAAEVRSIWYFHTVSNGWGDIGYNFLIDPDGVVYEGRAGGDGAIGAHFSCRNTNTVGIALLGTFTSVAPTPAALASLERVLGEICRRDGLDPMATTIHAPSALMLPTIIGHRDGNASTLTCTKTECPGDVLYALLPSIRAIVACVPPAIVAQPAGVAIVQGASATLSVEASGSEPLGYQWFGRTYGAEAQAIDGATGPSLTVAPATTTRYRVRVTNACGSVDSTEAFVTVGVQPRRRAARQ